MAVELFANGQSTTLSSGYTSGGSSISVTSSTGFPSPASGQQFHVSVFDQTTGNLKAIFSVTAVSGTTWTTTAELDANCNSGDIVRGTMLTAAALGQVKTDAFNAFPLTVVQEGMAQTNGGNVSSFAVTFNQTTAASGNTIFMFVSSDGSTTVSTPTGWTKDFDQVGSTYARLQMFHKTTASDTSASFTFTNSTMSVYFIEVVGSHALDQSTVASGTFGTNGAFVFPSITPTAGAAVFALCGVVGYCWVAHPLNPAWQMVGPLGNNNNTQRTLIGYVYRGVSNGAAIKPPAIITTALFQQNAGTAVFSIL